LVCCRYLKHLLELQETLSEFATDGLRTLVLGARVLTEDEVRLWMVSYTDAVNTVGPSRDDRLMDVANDAERGLHIVGATGIEDKLQEGVPECIEDLHTAGVKVLVLTGDKKETAIEIGYATKLLVPTMDLVEYDDKMDKKKVHDEVCLGASAQLFSTSLTRTLHSPQIIKEFLRLVKKGELPQFSRARLAKDAWEPGLAVKNFMRTTVLRKDRVMSKDEEKRATRACVTPPPPPPAPPARPPFPSPYSRTGTPTSTCGRRRAPRARGRWPTWTARPSSLHRAWTRTRLRTSGPGPSRASATCSAAHPPPRSCRA
jgi:hypothetical protein